MLLLGCPSSPAGKPDAAATGPGWSRFVSMPGGAPRWGMALALTPSERRLYGFGGAHGIDEPPLEETWSLSLRDQSWTRVIDLSPPPARARACTVYLPAQNELLVLGGGSATGALPGAWTFEVGTRNWIAISDPVPQGAIGCAAAWMGKVGRAIVFGGASDGGALDESWSYDPVAREFARLRPTQSPPARLDATLISDDVGGVLWLAGGSAATALDGAPLDDLWTFDGAGWARVDGTRPPARRGAAFAFDVQRREGVLFGGLAGATPLGDAWRFDAAAARFNALTLDGGPPVRAFAGAAYDPIGDAYVVVGGLAGDTPLADGWSLRLR